MPDAVDEHLWHQLGEPVTADETQALQARQARRDLLPGAVPTPAYANVTVRDREGRASEVDVILLHRNGLHFLGLKGWHWLITGGQMTWRVTPPNGRIRDERDPFLSTYSKAKQFASELKHAEVQHPSSRVSCCSSRQRRCCTDRAAPWT